MEEEAVVTRFCVSGLLCSVYTIDMTTTVVAHFDGKHSLVLDEPVDLPVGTPLRVHVEPVNGKTGGASLSSTALVTPAPRCFEPLDIQIDPELSHAIASDPGFNIEES